MLANSATPSEFQSWFGYMFQFSVILLYGQRRAYAAKLKNITCLFRNELNQGRLFILCNTNEETNGKGEQERHSLAIP